MGQTTSIEWTSSVDEDGTVTQGSTWNPVRGCSRVSEGCRHCYAERQAARFAGEGKPFNGFVTKVNGHPAWTGKVELVDNHLYDPLSWSKPRKIFVNSMSDLFHEGLSFDDIDQVFTVMIGAPQHTYQILTKRAKRMREYFTSGRHGHGMGPDRADYHMDEENKIWLGVSCEDQEAANKRIPHLLLTPARTRFVSYEPALGPVDFTRVEHQPEGSGGTCFINALTGKSLSVGGSQMLPRLDLVIVGGESGPGARSFDLSWAHAVVKRCANASVSCFVKQLGANPQEVALIDDATPTERDSWMRDGWTWIHEDSGSHWRRYLKLKDRKGGDMEEWPESLRVREFPQGHS